MDKKMPVLTEVITLRMDKKMKLVKWLAET